MFGKLSSMANDALKNDEQKPAEGQGQSIEQSGQQWAAVGEMAKKVATDTKERQARGEGVDVRTREHLITPVAWLRTAPSGRLASCPPYG